MTVLLYVKKRTNRLERFVLYTNLLISNFITYIYRKLSINYSKFHIKITKYVSFMKILLTPGFFCFGMQDGRGDSLHYRKNWLDPPNDFWPFWWENPLCYQLTSVWNPWTFFLSKLFLIITFLSDHFRSFIILEMTEIVMLKVWNNFWWEFHITRYFISYQQVLLW